MGEQKRLLWKMNAFLAVALQLFSGIQFEKPLSFAPDRKQKKALSPRYFLPLEHPT